MSTEPQHHIALTDKVEKLLRKSGFEYRKDVVVGQARPDFLVTTANGNQIVVEVKAWEGNPDTTARAINQAQRYKEMSKANAAVIVTSGTLESITSAMIAVTPLGGLLSTLAKFSSNLSHGKKQTDPQPIKEAPKRKVFASMPFAQQYDDTFIVAIEPASLANGAIAERVDHNGTAGPVVPQIKAMIKAAKIVIADLSDSRPNVLHEVGYAEALKIPVIQICCTPLAALPFNVRNNNTTQYTIGQSAKLKKALDAAIKNYV
jgi:hypothetical protein